MKIVGIIGGSGFIGSYVTKKFLKEGFMVKVSVTDKKNSDKYKHLLELDNSENLSITELKVEDVEALGRFVKGCSIIIHAGTPFQLDVEDPQTDLYEPTLKGTENILQLASRSPDLKKLVFVASIAAFNTNYPFPAAGKQPGNRYDYEVDDVPFISDEGHPYARAKYLAHEMVESYIDDHPNLSYEITSVSPAGVMGKALGNRPDSTSMGLQHLFKNQLAPNPFLEMVYEQDAEWALVSVKDVAKAIFKAATLPGLHGENYLLTSECWKTSDIVRMLNNEKPLGQATQTYNGRKAVTDLGISYVPAVVPLREYTA